MQYKQQLYTVKPGANYMLLKDDVGRARPFTHNLPQDNTHSYGKPLRRDKEGVSALTTKWKEHQYRQLGGTDKDFRSLNKSALKQKATTSHQQYQYRSGTDLRLKDPTESMATKTFYKTFNKNVDEETIYGKPLSPSTPIKEVLSNYFGEIGE